jgi:hypothetical protein
MTGGGGTALRFSDMIVESGQVRGRMRDADNKKNGLGTVS